MKKQHRTHRMGRSKSPRTYISVGIVADMRTDKGREAANRFNEVAPDPYYAMAVEAAIRTSMDFIIAVGYAGLPGMLITMGDMDSIAAAFKVANARIAEHGAVNTSWLIAPDEVKDLLHLEKWEVA